MSCTFCRKGTPRPADLTLERRIAGHVFVTTIKGKRCDQCQEEYFPAAAVSQFDRKVATALAEHRIAEPDAFRAMRKAVGLRATDLAELLETTPETISRWENGKHPIDRAALALVAAMVLTGDRVVAALRERAAAAPLASRVDLRRAS
jgi:putative zinc finger/helix-turn-helix YgiT family protein